MHDVIFMVAEKLTRRERERTSEAGPVSAVWSGGRMYTQTRLEERRFFAPAPRGFLISIRANQAVGHRAQQNHTIAKIMISRFEPLNFFYACVFYVWLGVG